MRTFGLAPKIFAYPKANKIGENPNALLPTLEEEQNENKDIRETRVANA